MIAGSRPGWPLHSFDGFKATPDQQNPKITAVVIEKSIIGSDQGYVPRPFVNGVEINSSPYENPRLGVIDRFIDEPRSLRVAVIGDGGGLAGIETGVLLPRKVSGIKLTVYEKNAGLVSSTHDFLVYPSLTSQAGTWFENIYPGVRCAILSYVYQSIYSPNTN